MLRSSLMFVIRNSKVSTFCIYHSRDPDHGDSPKYPGFPGSNPGQDDEQMNRGAGIYAVPFYQFGGHVAGLLPSNSITISSLSLTVFPRVDQAMRLRLGERTKRKAGRLSSSNKGKLLLGDLRLEFSLTYSSYSSLLLSFFCSTKMDLDKGSLVLLFSLLIPNWSSCTFYPMALTRHA